MTTQKTVTAEDVERWWGEVRTDVLSTIRVAGERALAHLRGTAAQVPALQKELDDAKDALDVDGAQSQEGSALAHRIAALSEDRTGEKVRAERAEENVAALQARVAELERERDNQHRRACDAVAQASAQKARAIAAESERDALRAQVEAMVGQNSLLERAWEAVRVLNNIHAKKPSDAAARSRALQTVASAVDAARHLSRPAALSAPPADAKTAEVLPPCSGCGLSHPGPADPCILCEAAKDLHRKRSCNLHADCDTEPGECCNDADCSDHQ